jgi:hypothetical protein
MHSGSELLVWKTRSGDHATQSKAPTIDEQDVVISGGVGVPALTRSVSILELPQGQKRGSEFVPCRLTHRRDVLPSRRLSFSAIAAR